MNKNILLLLTLSACTVLSAFAKNKTIEHPRFTAWNSSVIEIEKVIMSDTATVIQLKSFQKPQYTFRIKKGSVLKDATGKLYPIRRGVGITLDKDFIMSESGEATFQLIFPPIDEPITEVDFSEGEFNGAFKIWGIKLSNKTEKKNKYPDIDIPQNDPNEALAEPQFLFAKATLKGQIMDFPKGLAQTATMVFNDPIRMGQSVEFTIDANGSFSKEVEVISPTPVTLYFSFAKVECLLAPQQQTGVTINLKECCRQESKLQKGTKPYGEKFYYKGYLAGLQQELSNNQAKYLLNLQNLEKELNAKNVSEVKSYLLNKRNELLNEIKKSDLSEAAKKIKSIGIDALTSFYICATKDLVMHIHVVNQKMNKAQMMEYYKTADIEIPDDYYDIIKEFKCINSPFAVYSQTYAKGFYNYSINAELLKKALQTNKGVLFDFIEAKKWSQAIENFAPLTEQQKADFKTFSTPAFGEMLTVQNTELLNKIELNKKKSGFTPYDVPNVDNEKLFKAITSKYEGKVVLFDFWATWCGPCRMANKTMIPMKEELKDKPIIFVYLTGETSPKGTWENMITDIHGDHYRMSNAQWRYMMDSFEIKGVPTYFIVDKKGEIVFRETGFPGIDVMKEKLLDALNK